MVDHHDYVNVTWPTSVSCYLCVFKVSCPLASFPALCLSMWFSQTGIWSVPILLAGRLYSCHKNTCQPFHCLLSHSSVPELKYWGSSCLPFYVIWCHLAPCRDFFRALASSWRSKPLRTYRYGLYRTRTLDLSYPPWSSIDERTCPNVQSQNLWLCWHHHAPALPSSYIFITGSLRGRKMGPSRRNLAVQWCFWR